MTDKYTTEESIQFVARYFQENTLLPTPGWQKFKLSHGINSFRRNITAACIAGVVLVASASIYYLSTSTQNPTIKPDIVVSPSETVIAPEKKTMRIEFRDATLREVIDEIERVYNVKISNVPKEEMRITISYEGTASDVVETINDLLNTNLTVNPKTDISSRQ